MCSSDLEEDMQVLTSAVELVESANLLHIAFRAHINLGSAIQSFSGDTQRARQQYQRAADVARRRGALQEELFALTAVGGMLLEEGELNELSS